ncbi:hypothetical protein [Rhodoferax aquaticus]|uniref:Uncharacterized protein n=1 Tax=Rhodoferax aquaticus TaxID=2527691 RepID=A0A515ERN4_9BURK|nr:hypothetical protein [Rhodoferax aquaticus]QDL55314.1 hypothetical protein EXZ61_14685 [Rhodoferax aquaticus]
MNADHKHNRRHHSQVQLNVDIVKHVAQYQPCGFQELYALFGQTEEDKNATERFRARLGHLTYSKQLEATGSAAAKRWRMPQPSSAAAEKQVPASMPALAIVPPAQHNVMRAPPYVPEVTATARTGAMDFKRYGSRGFSC